MHSCSCRAFHSSVGLDSRKRRLTIHSGPERTPERSLELPRRVHRSFEERRSHLEDCFVICLDQEILPSSSAIRARSGAMIFFHLLRREARSYVFGTVPIVGNDLDEKYPLHFGTKRIRGKGLNKLGMLPGIENTRVPKQLQPGTPRIVHHENRHTVVALKVSGRKKLLVSVEIREAYEIRTKDTSGIPRGLLCCRYGHPVSLTVAM